VQSSVLTKATENGKVTSLDKNTSLDICKFPYTAFQMVLGLILYAL
jgi:hypothetical protein